MKPCHALVLSLLSLLAVAAEAATPVEIVARFHLAMQAGEQQAAQALLLPEVQIYESGYVERSRADYAAHHLLEDIAYAKTSKTKVLKQQASETGDLALVLSETETTDQSGKTPTRHAGTETMVLKRIDGDWRIAHVHWSSHKLKPL